MGADVVCAWIVEIAMRGIFVVQSGVEKRQLHVLFVENLSFIH